jgi:pSer/pThr/pTyr-binding forkhead associated (FHA) protein
MKVNLVVATGVHQGKAIPIPGAQLLIGRDPECQLRPASPAVSKKHCLISVRDGKVFIKDFGSTNGTFVNDAQLTDEIGVEDGDRVRIGPLDFKVQIIPADARPDSTPLPESLKALPAGGRLSDGVGVKPARSGTPMPMPKSPAAKSGSDQHTPLAAETMVENALTVPAKPKLPTRSDDPDAWAAALLAEDDGDAPPIPEGSTVMELPSADAERLRMMGGGPAAAGAKKSIPSAADSSNAANDILRKYMQNKRKN